MLQSITFDLDGTLLDTVGDLAEASRRMLLMLGLPPRSEAEIRRFVGRGVTVLVQRCLTQDRLPDADLTTHAVEIFKSHYDEINGQFSRPFPGVCEGLAAWQATGLPLGVVTNKPVAFTLPLLARSGLRDYFQVVISGDSTPFQKPHPEPLRRACAALRSSPQRNLHIGDSKHDIATARNAGSPVYCVPYGYNEGEVLKPQDCDALIANLLAGLAQARNSGWLP